MERAKLSAPTDERRVRREAGNRGRTEAAGLDAEAPQDSSSIWPLAGLAPQEIAAEGVQIDRNAVDQLGRRGRIEHGLPIEGIRAVAGERRFADERLVDERAHAVPITGGFRRLFEGLLRRHVRRCPDDVRLELPAVEGAREFGGDPEVEQHDPSVVVHEDVRRLDVAVHLAGHVRRVHPFDQLAERVAETADVRRGRPAPVGLGGRTAVHRDLPALVGGGATPWPDDGGARIIRGRERLGLHT